MNTFEVGETVYIQKRGNSLTQGVITRFTPGGIAVVKVSSYEIRFKPSGSNYVNNDDKWHTVYMVKKDEATTALYNRQIANMRLVKKFETARFMADNFKIDLTQPEFDELNRILDKINGAKP